ncbi:SusD family protein [compost metagenome]
MFLTGSKEAIWQLKQTNEYTTLKNATIEGYAFNRTANNLAAYGLTPQLLSSFEAADQRKLAWVGSVTSATPTPVVTAYPYKYKTGSTNGVINQPSPEYYVVFRLAEAYLIRAEAAANGAAGGTAAALADLKIIRNRAGLPDLAGNLNQQQIIAAVAKERRIEFFAEWGHRWFDLKRTGHAGTELSTIPLKQPWAGDYQLLYPIPMGEIEKGPFLTQNPGYEI